MRVNSGRVGFTLTEVVLAIGLLAVIALSLIAAFTKVFGAVSKNTDLEAARLLARRVLDRALKVGYPDWGVGPSHQGSVDLVTQDSGRATHFIYTVTPSLLKSDSFDFGGSPVKRELYYLEVEVSWWENGPSKERQGMGRMSTRLGQTIFVEH